MTKLARCLFYYFERPSNINFKVLMKTKQQKFFARYDPRKDLKETTAADEFTTVGQQSSRCSFLVVQNFANYVKLLVCL